MNERIPTTSLSRIVNFRRKLLAWGRRNYSNFPWRKTKNLFHALIAENMLQRTRAEQVLPIYVEFTRRYESPSEVLEDHEESVLAMLRPLGLFWRSRLMLNMIRELQDKGVQMTVDDLKKLPGIGSYAAGAMISFHGGKRAVIVDNNVVRLYSRYFGLKTNAETRRSKSFLSLADRITPRTEVKQFNYALLDHSRAICKSKPLCSICPLQGGCDYALQVRREGH